MAADDTTLFDDQLPPPVPGTGGSNSPVAGSFPKDWNIIEVGDLETILPATYEKIVRERLSEVSQEAKPLWGRAPLGELVEVQQVRALHCWTAARITVREERTVEDAFIPYQNERLPKTTVETPSEVDPGGYRFFAGDEDEGEESIDVPGSARVVTCHHCDRGKVECEECHGAGRVTCDECDGGGRLPCPECMDGEVQGARGYKKCPRCRGLGNVDCPSCKDGKSKCLACGGKGTTQCPTCDGRGKAIQVLRVRAKRTRTLLVEEDASPALDAIIEQLKISAIDGKIDSNNVVSIEQLKAWITPGFLVDDDSFEDMGMEEDIQAAIRMLREKIRAQKKRMDSAGLPSISDEYVQSLAGRFASIVQNNLNLTIQLPGYAHFRLSGDGYPLPPFRDELQLSRQDALGVRPDDEARSEDDAWFASVVATKTLQGATAPERPFPKRLSGKLVSALGRFVRTVPSSATKGQVIRDRLVVFVRSWIAADYRYSDKSYTAILGREGTYAPDASPVSDEATVLVEAARRAIAAEPPDGGTAASSVEQALSNTLIFPDPEALASLVTQVPKSKLKAAEKLNILGVIQKRLDLMSERREKFHALFLKSGERDQSLMFEGTLKFNTGRVTRDLVGAARQQVESAVAMRRTLIGTGVIVALVAVLVAVYFIVPARRGPEVPPASPAASPVQPQAPAPSRTEGASSAQAPSDTACGHYADKGVPAGLTREEWTGYRCLTRDEAGSRWSRCLNRKDYTGVTGKGCPGDARCCPSK